MPTQDPFATSDSVLDNPRYLPGWIQPSSPNYYEQMLAAFGPSGGSRPLNPANMGTLGTGVGTVNPSNPASYLGPAINVATGARNLYNFATSPANPSGRFLPPVPPSGPLMDAATGGGTSGAFSTPGAGPAYSDPLLGAPLTDTATGEALGTVTGAEPLAAGAGAGAEAGLGGLEGAALGGGAGEAGLGAGAGFLGALGPFMGPLGILGMAGAVFGSGATNENFNQEKDAERAQLAAMGPERAYQYILGQLNDEFRTGTRLYTDHSQTIDSYKDVFGNAPRVSELTDLQRRNSAEAERAQGLGRAWGNIEGYGPTSHPPLPPGYRYRTDYRGESGDAEYTPELTGEPTQDLSPNDMMRFANYYGGVGRLAEEGVGPLSNTPGGPAVRYGRSPLQIAAMRANEAGGQ